MLPVLAIFPVSLLAGDGLRKPATLVRVLDIASMPSSGDRPTLERGTGSGSSS
jgi:hypothetical protein